MKAKDLAAKLTDESPLSAEETLRLDGALERTEGVRRIMAARPEAAPNLQWRSALNLRLAQESGGRRRRRVLRWGGALATTAAAVTAFVALFPPGPRSVAPTSPLASHSSRAVSVEEAILQAHREDAARAAVGVEIPGPSAGRTHEVYDWSQLESL